MTAEGAALGDQDRSSRRRRAAPPPRRSARPGSARRAPVPSARPHRRSSGTAPPSGRLPPSSAPECREALGIGSTAGRAAGRWKICCSVGKALIAEGLREADQRRRLHGGLLGDARRGAEGDFVGIGHRIGGDLGEALRQPLAPRHHRLAQFGKCARDSAARAGLVAVDVHRLLAGSRFVGSGDQAILTPPPRMKYPFHELAWQSRPSVCGLSACETEGPAGDGEARGWRGERGIGVGLIGTGYMGKCHALAWNAGGADLRRRRAAAARPSRRGRPRRWPSAAPELGFDRASGDWRRVVEDPEVEIVSITTPNAFHAEMAIAALEAGKHVWCEKPMATALADAEAMLAAADRAGRVTALGYNYIQNPAIRHMRALVEAGAIGAVNHVRFEMDEDFMADGTAPFGWKSEAASGYGALDDFGVHPLSLLSVLVGARDRRSSPILAKPHATRRRPPAAAGRRDA